MTYTPLYEKGIKETQNNPVETTQSFIQETQVQKGEFNFEIRSLSNKTESRLRHAKGPAHFTPSFLKVY